ncbi:hypothetical protein NDU88_002703 [Pleurodeles waltl]|uniref:Uncharacterized protein n=1 Tax=Pleurodeles waltl TaxID=8319 RepID=A0AAV7UA11_PLEWA|nr:hypothetical protein NDU88_002703 [Pleurodeles waltl]
MPRSSASTLAPDLVRELLHLTVPGHNDDCNKAGACLCAGALHTVLLTPGALHGSHSLQATFFATHQGHSSDFTLSKKI